MRMSFCTGPLKNLTADKKRLASNFFSLSVVKWADVVLPLVTFPYLARVLGARGFGMVAFAQAFVNFFALIRDYGFNLSATKEISISRNDKEKVSEIFSSVMIAKAGFVLASFLIVSIAVLNLHVFSDNRLLYFLTFGTLVGNGLLPIWLFQGMEKMGPMAVLDLLARVAYTVSIFIFVRKTSDYIYVPVLSSVISSGAGLLALLVAVKTFGIRFKIPSSEAINHQLKEGWRIFTAMAANSLYSMSDTFILGLFASREAVGYYSAGSKIIRAAHRMLTPVYDSVYPYISKMAQESRENAIGFIRKMLKIAGIPVLLVSIILFCFAPEISAMALGKNFSESIPVLRILAFLPILFFLNNFFGMQTMLPLGLKKAFSSIFISAAALNILLALVLVPPMKQTGISIAVLITETYVPVAMLFHLYRRGVRLFKIRSLQPGTGAGV
ncbi:MAG: flippase [Actinomycetota bacterium]|nr:flippase [Actinomycetota bacterium]